MQSPQETSPDPDIGIGDWIGYFYYPWGVILQVLALIHLVRRRGEYYWFWIIFIGGGIGALAYIIIEVVPDVGLLREPFLRQGRKKQIRDLEITILDNPSAGNYEELGELYWDQREYAKARAAYDQAIAARSDSPHAFYRRGQCALALGDYEAAADDLELAFSHDPKFDYYNAAGSLAHAHGKNGNAERAEALFQFVAPLTTNLETLYNYACFLKSQNRTDDARAWAQRILEKKRTLPRYAQRRERPWFQRAKALLKEMRSLP